MGCAAIAEEEADTGAPVSRAPPPAPSPQAAAAAGPSKPRPAAPPQPLGGARGQLQSASLGRGAVPLAALAAAAELMAEQGDGARSAVPGAGGAPTRVPPSPARVRRILLQISKAQKL